MDSQLDNSEHVTEPETESQPSSEVNLQHAPSADMAIHKKPSKKKVMLIAMAVVLVLGAGAGAYFAFVKNKKTPIATNQQTQINVSTKTTVKAPSETEKQLARITNPTTGETWYTAPKALPLQNYSNPTYGPETTDNGVAYYEMGKRGDNVIILETSYSGGGTNTDLFEKAPDGKISAIIHPNYLATYPSDFDKNYSTSYRSDITLNTTQHYDSLSYPKDLSLSSTASASQYTQTYLGSFAEKPGVSTAALIYTTVNTYGGSKIVKKERPYVDTGLTAVSYSILTPISTEITLTYTPIVQTFDGMKWDNGNNITGKFGSIIRGCGAGASVGRADKVSDVDFVKSGTTVAGQTVYSFKDESNATVQKAWQESKDFFGYGGDTTDPRASVTLTEFLKQHGVFAYKDSLNGWLIYTNDYYAAIGGCAKPVVYLYPSTPQQVSVKVGADVKLSDPLYDSKTGWHAYVWPNGKLMVNGKMYDSLFWEGPGHGQYPGITTGTVVKRSDVVATMRMQLAQQGLKQNEINDFVDYWQNRVPNKPYVRLSWFSTAQLDELAPLIISPKPTTTIRVFLDMAGSDTDYSMPAPHFSAPARIGFTAVEWGGLSLTKLY